MIEEKTVDRLVDRNHELFSGFIAWLAKKTDNDMDAVLRAIEKPWSYTDEFNEYVGVVNMHRKIAEWALSGRKSQ